MLQDRKGNFFANPVKRSLFIIAVCITLSGVLYLMNTTALKIREIDVQYRKISLFSSLWLLWAPLSFLAIWLARRFPVTTVKTMARVKLHLVLAFCFAVFHGLLYILVMNVLADIFYPDSLNKVYIFSTLMDNFVSQVIIYLLIVAIDQGGKYVVKFREETLRNLTLQNQVAAAQNQLLKMQIQPHFLFNTHHSIISLMSLHKTKEAAEMLTKLSDLLRKTLDMPAKEFVTLREELELVRLYMDIQLIRFGDRLSIRYQLPAETLDKKIPVFIIQPLVENAIRHGIEPISDSGNIIISSFLRRQQLLIKIEDDGAGFNPVRTPGGIGLQNIKGRLDNHFGDRYSLQIQRREPRGTVIEIELPIQGGKL
ncbi:MAG: histidine kinase [Ferruginibacter sp.]